MNRQEIHKTIHEFFIRLKRLYREVEKDQEAGSIKSYRVQIKKLRSFLRLVAMELEDPDKLKLPKALRQQYKSGGKLRDLVLLEKKIEEAKNANPGIAYRFQDLLGKETKRAVENEEKLLLQKDFETAETKLTAHLPSGYSTLTLKRFLNGKLAAIRAIIERGKFSDKELHEIRKLLKDILYTLKLYRENLKTELGFPFWSPEEVKKVKTLEEWLGVYNDNRIAVLFLPLRRIKEMNQNEKELLLSLRQQLLMEGRELKKQIIFSLRTIDFEKIT